MVDIAQSIADEAAPSDGKRLAVFWQEELATAERLHKNWHMRGDKIIDRYLDERSEETDRDLVKASRRMNILWSNVETLKPTLLAKRPIPNVTRANKDKDPVGRWAAIVLERCIAAQLRDDQTLNALKEARSDLLLPGRGVVFESYDAEIEEADVDDPQAQPGARITEQKTLTEYVHWKDFFTNRARNWFEVWWVAKRAFLTRKELVAKYGKKGKLVPLDHKPDETQNRVTGEQGSKATVYQVWDKNAGDIVEFAKEFKDDILAKMKPPVEFDGFFPCPRPIFATLAGKDLIPTPDYAQYQDQAEEIDQMTNRIGGLTRALKLRGVYDASNASLAQLFNDASENELVPVDSFALFAEKGGIKGAIEWVPIKEVSEALLQCMRARDDAKRVMYEVTGISDIVRGQSVASETATAQQLKSQWGSIRIKDRQQDIERFARDVLRLKSEIIASQFTQETLAAMSNVKLLTQAQKQAVIGWQQMMQARQMQAQPQPGMPPPPPQPLPPPPVPQDMMALMTEPSWEDVIGLLRNERLRSFVIDVETDSTIEPDQDQMRQDRVAFVTAITQYMMAAEKILMSAPQMAPLMGELLTFAVRGWKVGEQMETKIEDAVALMEKTAQEPKGPDPKMLQVQAKQQADMAKIQAGHATTQMQTEAENQRTMVQAGIEHGWQQLEAAKLTHATGHANADRHAEAGQVNMDRLHEAALAGMQRHHDGQQADADRQHQQQMAAMKPAGGEQ